MRKLFLFLIPAIILLCGCDNCNLEENVEQQPALLSVAEVSFAPRSASGMSKSVFRAGDEIGLFIRTTVGMSYNKLTYIEPLWSFENPFLLPGGLTEIQACYPYHAGRNPPGKLWIDHDSGTDYLYSSGYYAHLAEPVLKLDMNHALALIEFEFEVSSQTENQYIERISIEGPGLSSMALLDIFTGEIEQYEEIYEPAVLYGWQLTHPYIQYNTKVGIMVVPTETTHNVGEILFDLNIGGIKAHWPVPAGTCWQSGKRYTYKVQIHERRLNIIQVEIRDWTNAGKEKIPLSF